MKKNNFWIDSDEEDEYPDTDELEYQDKLETSKKRRARLAKQEKNQTDIDLKLRTEKDDKKL